MSFEDYQEILERNNEKYKKIEENSGYQEFPDGLFEFTITKHAFQKSQFNNEPQLMVSFRCDGPVYIGKTNTIYYSLENEFGLKALKWMLKTIDISLHELTELMNIHNEIDGKRLVFKVVTKPDNKGIPRKRFYPQKHEELAVPGLDYDLPKSDVPF